MRNEATRHLVTFRPQLVDCRSNISEAYGLIDVDHCVEL